MPTCVPIKDMKDTAAFTRTVEEAPSPVTVTKNGYDTFVVMRTDDYEAMQQEIAKARLLGRIAQAEHEYATGQHIDGSEAVAALREKYGL
jgi:prevent-host-death family protein